MLLLMQICRSYVQHLAERGTDVPSYRANLMKRKLEKHSGRNESPLVYASVSAGELVEELVKHSMAQECNQAEEGMSQYKSMTAILQDLYHSTLYICSDVMAVENITSWPPTVEDFDDDEMSQLFQVHSTTCWHG